MLQKGKKENKIKIIIIIKKFLLNGLMEDHDSCPFIITSENREREKREIKV